MTTQTVSKSLEVIPLIAAGGVMWSDPTIVSTIIFIAGSIIIALINLYGKLKTNK